MTIVPRGTLTSKASQSTVGKVNFLGQVKWLAEQVHMTIVPRGTLTPKSS